MDSTAATDYLPVTISLDRLRANEDFQPRNSGLEERHVRLLAASDPAAWPPLLVTPNEAGGFDVIDGSHRLAAARRLGLSALPCRVDPSAGYPEAVEANLRHGLPLPVADRKFYARWLRDRDPTLSFRELGRRAGLNHETVRRAIEEPEVDEAEGGENRQARLPDPIPLLVRQVDRAYRGGHGRTWLGVGSAGNPRPFRRALERYADEDRARVARALSAFGHACVAAAEPILSGDEESEP